MIENIEKQFENALKRFDESAKTAKEVVESSKSIDLGLDEEKLAGLLDLVDQRINKVATDIRSEMAEERKLIIKHEKKSLMINIGIAAMAVVAFIFNKILS
ncbi:hypothetical protein [Aliivibrio fischeri]|uniref:hypothetical protein n=1 Tax=Aliivibrio fischeri TaxID=668 RepID=UPI00080E6313|nr:hypothetical protein [Aliivibrio fischeri]MCE4934596.1 hypothetical protein [Aliivibrio fischeri]MUH96577.1 hypothetical protein [Aliivibrio fischeri]MUI63073.1 hypothetical protein [Aliivibrio fischeri]OCH09643.1 hypothetical protein A6E09_12320 [Aliivibrio fischeri]OCH61979.1 hypothetical protein A6D98_06950 [Aliivibrio fischeri]